MKKKNHFAPDGFRIRNSADKKQVIYPLQYKHRLVITDRTFHLNYSKITVCLKKSCDLKLALLLINIYINKDYQ